MLGVGLDVGVCSEISNSCVGFEWGFEVGCSKMIQLFRVCVPMLSFAL